MNRRRRVFELKYARAWKNEYTALGGEMMKLINQFGPESIDRIDGLKMDGLTKLWTDMYADAGVAFATDAYNQFAKSWSTTYETKAKRPRATPLLTDAWIRRMKAYATDQAGEFIVTIQQTARDEMRRIVGGILDAGFTEGASRDTMARHIAASFQSEWGDAADWMGRRVAQTEMIRASNYGTLEGIDSLGIPYDRVWYAGGANIRPTHEAAHGQIVDAEEPFDIGGFKAYYPGDPSLPPEESINCKCAVSARPKGGY